MSFMQTLQITFFVLRRAFVRVIGLFAYAQVVEQAGCDGLNDIIWNQGHFWAFLSIGIACNLVIDLVIEMTKPDFVLSDKPDDSCQNE